MINITSDSIITSECVSDAILNTDYEGFREDYLVLHCLLRKHMPKRFFEVGCNMGVGTRIIKNALGKESEVMSLDLPTELAHESLQHPISEGKGDSVGHRCDLPFTLLRGDSLKFDYTNSYPINGWFIDGEHDYDHPYHEAKQAIRSGAEIIVFHDSDIPCVFDAIEDAFDDELAGDTYNVYRVTDTRIAYAVKKYSE